MRPALCLLLLLGTATPARADDARVRKFLVRWAARMRAAKTLRVRFEQTKTLRVLRRPRKSTGSADLADHDGHLLGTATPARADGARAREFLSRLRRAHARREDAARAVRADQDAARAAPPAEEHGER